MMLLETCWVKIFYRGILILHYIATPRSPGTGGPRRLESVVRISNTSWPQEREQESYILVFGIDVLHSRDYRLHSRLMSACRSGVAVHPSEPFLAPWCWTLSSGCLRTFLGLPS